MVDMGHAIEDKQTNRARQGLVIIQRDELKDVWLGKQQTFSRIIVMASSVHSHTNMTDRSSHTKPQVLGNATICVIQKQAPGFKYKS
jgi:hypothetical protein